MLFEFFKRGERWLMTSSLTASFKFWSYSVLEFAFTWKRITVDDTSLVMHEAYTQMDNMKENRGIKNNKALFN